MISLKTNDQTEKEPKNNHVVIRHSYRKLKQGQLTWQQTTVNASHEIEKKILTGKMKNFED